VEAPNALVLVDSGVGAKESAKFRDIYGVDNAGNPTRLEDALHSLGYRPEDVDLVVNTHLHFDHAGGNTREEGDGGLVPNFPDARYVVQRGELDFARLANERVRASYMAKNFDPIDEAGLWYPAHGETQLVDGVRLLPTPGHTPHHQSVIVESQGETAVFLADLCPTAAHLPLPWIMGYDLEPLRTLETKRRLWETIREEGWLMIFQHDTELPWGRMAPDSDRPAILPA
jgi:glyoxylase-like metal-dependent hydrolase (beta-lactamase superfamily II)